MSKSIKKSEKFVVIKSFDGIDLDKRTVESLDDEKGLTFKDLINSNTIRIGDRANVKDRRSFKYNSILKEGERMLCFSNVDDIEFPVFFDFIFTLEEYKNLIGL